LAREDCIEKFAVKAEERVIVIWTVRLPAYDAEMFVRSHYAQMQPAQVSSASSSSSLSSLISLENKS